MLKKAALIAVLTLAPLVAEARVDVVKILSLACSVCYNSETQDVAIASAVRVAGGRFVPAPVPTGPEDTGDREKVYYAARDFSPAAGESVKRSMYRALIEVGTAVSNLGQVYSWLQREGQLSEDDLRQIMSDATGPSPRSSLSRAVRLAEQAGVSHLPAYILIVDGQVHSAIDPTNVGSGSLTALRDEVISRVKSLSRQ